MILYALFTVVFAIASELYNRTTSRPAGAFRAAFHQETTAGHLAAGPDRIRRARRLIQPRFGLTLTIAHFIRLKPSRGILRVTRAYSYALSYQAKQENRPPESRKRAGHLGSAPKIISIFRHQILLFWCQKPLGCVSKIEFFKNPKILDRGDF